MRDTRGITLIALIITIIVLLILAGVTVKLTIGDRGIFETSKIAKEETNKSQATEIMKLKIVDMQMESYAKYEKLPSLQYVSDKLCEDADIEYVKLKGQTTASLEHIDITGHDSIFTKLKEYSYEFEIDSSLQLASINGVEISEIENSKGQEISFQNNKWS